MYKKIGYVFKYIYIYIYIYVCVCVCIYIIDETKLFEIRDFVHFWH